MGPVIIYVEVDVRFRKKQKGISRHALHITGINSLNCRQNCASLGNFRNIAMVVKNGAVCQSKHGRRNPYDHEYQGYEIVNLQFFFIPNRPR